MYVALHIATQPQYIYIYIYNLYVSSLELDTNHFVDNITSPNIYLNTLINGIGPSPGEQEGGHEVGDANDSVVDLTCDTNDDVIDLTKVKTVS